MLRILQVVLWLLYFTILDECITYSNKMFTVDYQKHYSMILQRQLKAHYFFSTDYILSKQEEDLWKCLDNCRLDSIPDELKNHGLYQYFKQLLDNCPLQYKRAFKQFFKRQVKRV